LTESNRFVWPGPNIRPLNTNTGYHGPLPPALFAEVKRRFVELARAQRHQAAARSELLIQLQCSIPEAVEAARRVSAPAIFSDLRHAKSRAIAALAGAPRKQSPSIRDTYRW